MHKEKKLVERREFILKAGAAFLLPSVVGCGAAPSYSPYTAKNNSSSDTIKIPESRPLNWNPIEFNLTRGLAGAVPASYQQSIAGTDGPLLHIGQHMPYVADIEKSLIPANFIGIMMGDSSRGYAKHPAAETHFFDYIHISIEGKETSNVISSFTQWPMGSYLVKNSGLITENNGADTIYLAALPSGTKPGTTIRVIAHCNLHGEYVDFITL